MENNNGVKGFASNNSKAVVSGMAGGRISRRPRTIKLGDPLTSDEMIFMAEGIGEVISSSYGNKVLTADELRAVEEKTNAVYSDLLTTGKWDLVFSQTLTNPAESLASWKKHLLKRWKSASELLNSGDKLTEYDTIQLRSLRNVSEAYNVATNTKTKWSQEAKHL